MLTANSQLASSCLRYPVSMFSTPYVHHPTSPSPFRTNMIGCPVWDTQLAPRLQIALCRSSRGACANCIFLQQIMHAYVYMSA